MKPIKVTHKREKVSGAIVAFVPGADATIAIVAWDSGHITEASLAALEVVQPSEFAKWHGMSE